MRLHYFTRSLYSSRSPYLKHERAIYQRCSRLSLGSGYAIYMYNNYDTREISLKSQRSTHAVPEMQSPVSSKCHPTNESRSNLSRNHLAVQKKKEERNNLRGYRNVARSCTLCSSAVALQRHCRRPRAKTLALLRPEATLYVPCVISLAKVLRRPFPALEISAVAHARSIFVRYDRDENYDFESTWC